MNKEDLKNQTKEGIDEAKERLDETKENVEDMYHESIQTVGEKGGEIKGRMEQWAGDTFNDDQSEPTPSADIDPNPLDNDSQDSSH